MEDDEFLSCDEDPQDQDEDGEYNYYPEQYDSMLGAARCENYAW